jgi:hypothetical protein
VKATLKKEGVTVAQITKETFRHVIGHFASGVTVLTTSSFAGPAPAPQVSHDKESH